MYLQTLDIRSDTFALLRDDSILRLFFSYFCSYFLTRYFSTGGEQFVSSVASQVGFWLVPPDVRFLSIFFSGKGCFLGGSGVALLIYLFF